MDRTNIIAIVTACILTIFFALSIAMFCLVCYTIMRVQKYQLEHQPTAIISQPKDKELEILFCDKWTYCIKIIMQSSRENGKPASLAEAELACSKLR